MSSDKPLVLVVGGSGHVGVSVVTGLLNFGKARVAITSRPGSSHKPTIKALQDRGVEIRELDIVNDDLAKLESALQGVQVVISTVSSTILDSQRRVIDAAKKVGVRRVVPCDFGTFCPGPGFRDMFDEKLAIRDYIKQVDIGYTFIDIGWWMQVALPHRPDSKDMFATFTWEFVGDGSKKNAVTNLDHVGDLVSRIIDDARTLNQYVFIAEDEVTQAEAWAIAERISGESFATKKIPMSEEDLGTRIAETRAAYAKSPSLMTRVPLSKPQYQQSVFVLGHNTVANAKQGGALVARELYPDVPTDTLEAYAKQFYASGPPKFYYNFD